MILLARSGHFTKQSFKEARCFSFSIIPNTLYLLFHHYLHDGASDPENAAAVTVDKDLEKVTDGLMETT